LSVKLTETSPTPPFRVALTEMLLLVECTARWPAARSKPSLVVCYDTICYTGTDWNVSPPTAEWGLPAGPRLGDCRRWIDIPSGNWDYVGVELHASDAVLDGSLVAAHIVGERIRPPLLPPIDFEFCHGDGYCEPWNFVVGDEVLCYDNMSRELSYDECYDYIPKTLWRLTLPIPAGQAEEVWIQNW
jgi:hypothetical protein